MEPMTRIYTLQYLRALAALAVVALHGANRVADALPAALASVLALGHAGVDLFFVISGFIMWSIARDAAISPATFLARRIIRVAPPYWIATLVWVGLVSAIGYDWITVTAEHTFLSLGFVPHFSPTFWDRVWPVVMPDWTLNYEMFFYLVFAGTLLAGRHLREIRPKDSGVLVLAIKREGEDLDGIPSADEVLIPGDVITAYGKEEDIRVLCSHAKVEA